MGKRQQALPGMGRRVEVQVVVVVVLVGYATEPWPASARRAFCELAAHALGPTGVALQGVEWPGINPWVTVAWQAQGAERSVSDIVTIVKSVTARGLAQRCPEAERLYYGGKLWTPSYGAFSGEERERAEVWGKAEEKRMAKLISRANQGNDAMGTDTLRRGCAGLLPGADRDAGAGTSERDGRPGNPGGACE